MSTNERDENLMAVVHAAVFSAATAALLGCEAWRKEAKERVLHGDTGLTVYGMACKAGQEAADEAVALYEPYKA